uniref:Uncharacterized protein n=1 Tax=Anguilla anguilla TaxID=7936 RepID=A0A0E9RTL5_ANGAN
MFAIDMLIVCFSALAALKFSIDRCSQASYVFAYLRLVHFGRS